MCLEIKGKLFALVSSNAPETLAEKSNAKFCQDIMDILDGEVQRDVATQQRIIDNFCYCVKLIQDDLREIDERIEKMTSLVGGNQFSDANYEKKKLIYFIKINKAAKEEIITFFSKNLVSFILSEPNAELRQPREHHLDSLMLFSRYSYADSKRFYDPNYDFSTEAKIRFLPGVDRFLPDEDIRDYIDLKKKNPEAFNSEVDRIVAKNNAMDYIADVIRSRYTFRKRAELFDTLAELYKSGKYASFISLAMTQLEGIFYDCMTVKYGEERFDKAGTLVEKAEKAFSTNDVAMKAIYPYFAFELPILRNQIAHSGMLISDNLQHTANEIILDLYCAVFWTCKLNDEKYIPLRMAYDKLTELKDGEDEASTLFLELFSSIQVSDRAFLDVLADPEKFMEELTFYENHNDQGEQVASIKSVVEKLSTLIKSEVFWRYANSTLTHITEWKPGKPYDLVDYLMILRNKFIAHLPNESPEKRYCMQISTALKQYAN